jgi:hypothetical protein
VLAKTAARLLQSPGVIAASRDSNNAVTTPV